MLKLLGPLCMWHDGIGMTDAAECVALCISSINTGKERFGILVNTASLQGSSKGEQLVKFQFHCGFSISDKLCILLVDCAGRHISLIMSLFFMSSLLEVNTTAALLFVIVILCLLLEYAFLPSAAT